MHIVLRQLNYISLKSLKKIEMHYKELGILKGTTLLKPYQSTIHILIYAVAAIELYN